MHLHNHGLILIKLFMYFFMQTKQMIPFYQPYLTFDTSSWAEKSVVCRLDAIRKDSSKVQQLRIKKKSCF